MKLVLTILVSVQVDGGCDSSSSDDEKMVIALDEDVDSDVTKRSTTRRATKSLSGATLSGNVGVVPTIGIVTRGRSASPMIQSPSVLKR